MLVQILCLPLEAMELSRLIYYLQVNSPAPLPLTQGFATSSLSHAFFFSLTHFPFLSTASSTSSTAIVFVADEISVWQMNVPSGYYFFFFVKMQIIHLTLELKQKMERNEAGAQSDNPFFLLALRKMSNPYFHARLFIGGKASCVK